MIDSPHSEPAVIVEIRGATGWITLNRPDQLNTLSPDLKHQLFSATARFEHDDTVRCVVIRARGKHFMAGGDIKAFKEKLDDGDPDYFENFESRVVDTHQIIYQLRRMAKPVVASVHGAVAGFGMSLVLSADLAIAAEDSFFTLAYRHIGLSADGGASYFLPRLIGERRALEIILLGDRFSARRAHELGIVNFLVARDMLAEETEKLATRLASGPTTALAIAKRLIRTSLDHSWDEQSHREAEGIAASVRTHDHREGVHSFLEKRQPKFIGK